jgi:predicted dehydrogenase
MSDAQARPLSHAKHLTRRDFVQRAGASLAAGLVAAPAVLPAGALNNDSELRLAWIGVGDRGTSLLLTALDHVSSSNLRIAAVCDIDESARNRGVKRCGSMKPEPVDDYRKLLEMKGIDAVVIATPIYLHAEMAAACAEAGRHAYCEKPLSNTAEGVKLAYEAVKRSGIVFQLGFQWRYHPIWQQTIEKVHNGAIGKVCYVHAYRHAGGYPTSGWYIDRNLSGDLIVEQAVHEMNIFCWLLKGPPLRAAGFGGINALKGVPANRTIMDHYSVSYQFPEEVELSYSHVIYCTAGADGMRQMVYGNHSAADLMSGEIVVKGKREKPDFPSLPEPTGAALASFVDCVRQRKRPLCDVEAGRNATLMAILGRTAIHEKRVVEWSEVAL